MFFLRGHCRRLLGFMLFFQFLIFCYVVHILPVFGLTPPSSSPTSISSSSSLPLFSALHEDISAQGELLTTRRVAIALSVIRTALSNKRFKESFNVLRGAVNNDNALSQQQDERLSKMNKLVEEAVGAFTQLESLLSVMSNADYLEEWVVHENNYITEPGDIMQTSSEGGLDHCRKLCEEDANCFGITQNKITNMCVLKAQGQLGHSEDWHSELKRLTGKRQLSLGRAEALVQNQSDWDGTKCLTSGIVVPAKGVRACEFQRDITDTYTDSFGVVVDRKNQSLRFFRKDVPCGPWGLELQWTCYFRADEKGGEKEDGKTTKRRQKRQKRPQEDDEESKAEEEDGGDGGGDKNSENALIANRLAQAIAEAKRMVKVGKQALAKNQEQSAYRAQWQIDHYPRSDFERLIHAGATGAELPAFSIATFNLWGYQHWQGRGMNVATALAERNLSIIGFQEVRKLLNDTTQLDILREHPAFREYHVMYHGCHQVVDKSKPENAARAESEGYEEGLGFLSRWPIVSSEAVILPHHPGLSSDPNTRCALMVTVNASQLSPELSKLQLVLSHISYADTQQCLNTVGLLQWANLRRTEDNPQILLGDFNTYFGWEWPMDVFTRQEGLFESEANPCYGPQQERQELKVVGGGGIAVPPLLSMELDYEPFRDGWTEVFENTKLGFTFSNVPDVSKLWDDNPPCRPDRIYFRGNLVTLSGQIIGEPSQLFETVATETPRLSDHLGVELLLLVDDQPRLRLSRVQQARENLQELAQAAGHSAAIANLQHNVDSLAARGVSSADIDSTVARVYSAAGCRGAFSEVFPFDGDELSCSPCTSLCLHTLNSGAIAHSMQLSGNGSSLSVTLETANCEDVSEEPRVLRENVLPSDGCIDLKFSVVAWQGIRDEDLQLHSLRVQLAQQQEAHKQAQLRLQDGLVTQMRGVVAAD